MLGTLCTSMCNRQILWQNNLRKWFSSHSSPSGGRDRNGCSAIYKVCGGQQAENKRCFFQLRKPNNRLRIMSLEWVSEHSYRLDLLLDLVQSILNIKTIVSHTDLLSLPPAFEALLHFSVLQQFFSWPGIVLSQLCIQLVPFSLGLSSYSICSESLFLITLPTSTSDIV